MSAHVQAILSKSHSNKDLKFSVRILKLCSCRGEGLGMKKQLLSVCFPDSVVASF